MLGKGGFGEVVSVRNRLDGRIYAIKKIRLKRKFKAKIIREVKMLSRLYHKNIIRYYQSWIEVEALDSATEAATSSDVSGFGTGTDGHNTPFGGRNGAGGEYSGDSLVESVHHADDDDYSSTLDVGAESDWLRESIPSYHYRGAALMQQNFIQRHGQHHPQPQKVSPPLQPGRLLRQKSAPRMVARNLASELSSSQGGDHFAIHDRDWNLEHGDDVFDFHANWESEQRVGPKTASTPFGSSSTASTSTAPSLSGSLSSGLSSVSSSVKLSAVKPTALPPNPVAAAAPPPLRQSKSATAAQESSSKDSDDEIESESVASRSETATNDGDDDDEEDYSDVSFSNCSFGNLAHPSGPIAAKQQEVAAADTANKPKTIPPGSWEMEECDLCGAFYHDWTVPNEHWDNLQMGMRNMSLCESCYADQLQQVGVDLKAINIKQLAPVAEQPQYLYIQMDYCERTLRHVIDEGILFEGNGINAAWRIFGQILEGLVCILSPGLR